MAIPHHFPSLVDDPTKQTVLIVGTGLSAPTAPTVDALKSRLDKVANELGVAPNCNFYLLAESVLNECTNAGKSDAESRLWLAEKLGLLDDRRWFGEIGLPLSGNTPRHRAIARFAVEKRLRAIVSLNWDTLLEAALDSVGLADGGRSPRPWEMTAHASVVDNDQIPNLGNAHVFPVIKPHGCVRNIEQARRQFRATGITPAITFKLKESELDNLPAVQTLVDQEVQSHVAQCPLLAIGWKAREGYLRDTIVKIAQAAKRTEPDSFTLASRSWYPNDKCKDTYHDDVAGAYGKTKIEAFAEVGNPGQPTLDCLFRWLQTRHGLKQLIAVSAAPHKASLQLLLQQLDQLDCDNPIHDLVDSWLPTWVRLCWRVGAMQGIDPHTNQIIQPWDIPVMPRDVHVPLVGMNMIRRELQAAAKLIAVVGSDLAQFNFDQFPGGFWQKEARTLYIPLPGWRSAAAAADLAALKPLVEALRGLGFVRTIRLIWLDTEDALPDPMYRDQLAAHMRRLMPLATFAAEDALTWVDLGTLKGDSHEAVA